MKKLFRLLIFLPIVVFSQNSHLPYQVGEYCSYDISFGIIRAGHADLTIKGFVEKNNKTTFHIIGRGRTAPFFDWFFKVRDVYETYIDTQSLKPIFFQRDVYEGGHTINQSYYFQDQTVESKDSLYVIPKNTQDMLSALFFARTLNKKKVMEDSVFTIPIFMDEEMYTLEVRYLHKQKLKTKWGKIDCLVFKPKMQKGRVFEDNESMKIWISNDENYLLIKAEARIWAGTIKAELKNYKELKTPLSIIE